MRIVIVSVLCVLTVIVRGQDIAAPSPRNQVVKLVLTPNLIYSSAFVLSYERVMKENQTLNVTGGFVEFPHLFSSSNQFRVDRNNSSGGYMVGVDYRFYLKKENKYTAPHGVYIAPFVSIYHFKNDRDIRDITSSSSSDVRFVTSIDFLNFGGQIGYQFVVKDRWTFDFIFFGPTISNYKFDLDLQGGFTVDQENEIVKELLDRFPLLDKLIDDKSVTVRGSNSKWAPGYRFSAMVGYKFGSRKKK